MNKAADGSLNPVEQLQHDRSTIGIRRAPLENKQTIDDARRPRLYTVCGLYARHLRGDAAGAKLVGHDAKPLVPNKLVASKNLVSHL